MTNKGKRIVLTTHGTLGDLHPFLAIALELKARGHRPLIATSEYHRRTIEAARLEFHPVRPDLVLHDRELQRCLTEPSRGLERVIREFMAEPGNVEEYLFRFGQAEENPSREATAGCLSVAE